MQQFNDEVESLFSELDDEVGQTEAAADELGDALEDEEEQAEAGREAYISAVGDDGEVDAYELRDILNATFAAGR